MTTHREHPERFGTSVAYPNGRCEACGNGLDDEGRCYISDCSAFNPAADGIPDGEVDLPPGYRWLNERESERYGAHPEDMPDVIVVRRTVDSTGVRYTQDEADLARPV